MRSWYGNSASCVRGSPPPRMRRHGQRQLGVVEGQGVDGKVLRRTVDRGDVANVGRRTFARATRISCLRRDVGRGNRVVELPRTQVAKLRIHREEMVQCGRPGTRQPEDHQRAFDTMLHFRTVLGVPRFDAQSDHEPIDDQRFDARDRFVVAYVVLDGGQKMIESHLPSRRSEIRQARCSPARVRPARRHSPRRYPTERARSTQRALTMDVTGGLDLATDEMTASTPTSADVSRRRVDLAVGRRRTIWLPARRRRGGRPRLGDRIQCRAVHGHAGWSPPARQRSRAAAPGPRQSGTAARARRGSVAIRVPRTARPLARHLRRRRARNRRRRLPRRRNTTTGPERSHGTGHAHARGRRAHGHPAVGAGNLRPRRRLGAGRAALGTAVRSDGVGHRRRHGDRVQRWRPSHPPQGRQSERLRRLLRAQLAVGVVPERPGLRIHPLPPAARRIGEVPRGMAPRRRRDPALRASRRRRG